MAATVHPPAQCLPGAEPFCLEAPGEAACLLIHGFTGSAYEVRGLGEHLASSGIKACGLLLRGHGTAPEDLLGLSFLDWVQDVETALDELLAEGRRVFLCGLSMGGTLALNVAARRADEPRLAGVIVLAAPLHLADWRLALLPFARWLVRWRSWGRPDIRDERQWDRHVAYRRYHLSALLQLLALLRDTRRRIARVHQPLLVVQSRFDHTVPAANARLIVSSVSSRDRRLLWLDNSYHVITLDFDAPRVCEEVTAFIRERTP